MRWIALPTVLVTIACTGGTEPKDTSGTEQDSSGTTTPTTTEPTPMGRISGIIVDETGAPWPDATVNLCREVCRLDRTDTTGAFSIEAEGGIWALEVVVDPTDPASGWSTPLFPVEIAVEVDRVLDAPVVVYALDAIQPLTAPGELELTPGFFVTADPAEWEAPILTPDADPWLAAVRFNFAASGTPTDGLSGTVLDAWMVAPTTTHPTAPWPIRLSSASLASDQTAEVWVSDYATQAWLPAGTVSSDEDGLLRGASLTTLGTVVLVEPAP